ncbi:MAG: glycerol-3-phosphate 1-O-acyltransferase PlsY [Thiohalocapsa sp.]
MLTTAALVLGAYLLGSVSSAIIVCRIMGLPDPRTQGSNNPGATNVLRIGGSKARPAAAVTLAGDMLKGVLPMLGAHALGAAPLALALVGIAAFVGHLFPAFFGFRGGKGVATALGVQFGLYWPIGAVTAAVWLFVAKVLRISSLSALVSMALAPVVVWLIWPEPALIGMQLVLTGLLFLRHRSNIRKLLRGEEGRIGAAAEEGPRAES